LIVSKSVVVDDFVAILERIVAKKRLFVDSGIAPKLNCSSTLEKDKGKNKRFTTTCDYTDVTQLKLQK